jgi:hypothetical protein
VEEAAVPIGLFKPDLVLKDIEAALRWPKVCFGGSGFMKVDLVTEEETPLFIER